jgi:hypothetical protein
MLGQQRCAGRDRFDTLINYSAATSSYYTLHSFSHSFIQNILYTGSIIVPCPKRWNSVSSLRWSGSAWEIVDIHVCVVFQAMPRCKPGGILVELILLLRAAQAVQNTEFQCIPISPHCHDSIHQLHDSNALSVFQSWRSSLVVMWGHVRRGLYFGLLFS